MCSLIVTHKNFLQKSPTSYTHVPLSPLQVEYFSQRIETFATNFAPSVSEKIILLVQVRGQDIKTQLPIKEPTSFDMKEDAN